MIQNVENQEIATGYETLNRIIELTYVFNSKSVILNVQIKQVILIPLDLISCFNLSTPMFNITFKNSLCRFNHLFVFLPFHRSKWSNVAMNECIFELPNLTIQATRAQTFLIQTVWQSWAYTGNVNSPVVNEALVNEVFQPSGKSTLF